MLLQQSGAEACALHRVQARAVAERPGYKLSRSVDARQGFPRACQEVLPCCTHDMAAVPASYIVKAYVARVRRGGAHKSGGLLHCWHGQTELYEGQECESPQGAC